MSEEARRLPQRVRKYLPAERMERPKGLNHWRLQFGKPPYKALEPVWDESDVLQRLSPGGEPPRGPVLVAEPGNIDPNQGFPEVVWLRTTLPWLSLIVLVREPGQSDPLGRRITGLARAGALVVPRREIQAGEIALAAQGLLDPRNDFARWIARVVPGLPASMRRRATEELAAGFFYDPETLHLAHPEVRLRSRTRVWIQVGRALKAAMGIQLRGEKSLSRVASEASYSDLRAMSRALSRSFGIPPGAIEDTVGWEWLLWRFLCGHGQGKAKSWDC